MINMTTISEQITTACPIKLTEGAVTEIRQLIYEKEVPEGHALRIGVKGGGCSGFTYILGFDAIEAADASYKIEGINIIVNKAQAMYLAGMEIDFHNGLKNRGFTFSNPNATETCGCGTSFSA